MGRRWQVRDLRLEQSIWHRIASHPTWPIEGSGQATNALGRHSAHKARQIEEKSGYFVSLPVSNEDLERGDEVSEGDALVSLPLLVGLNIIDEDDEVVAALVVDLGLLSLAASHCGCAGVRKENLCWW